MLSWRRREFPFLVVVVGVAETGGKAAAETNVGVMVALGSRWFWRWGTLQVKVFVLVMTVGWTLKAGQVIVARVLVLVIVVRCGVTFFWVSRVARVFGLSYMPSWSWFSSGKVRSRFW